MSASPTSTPVAPGRFCSVVAAEAGEDPVGSAWATGRYLAMELPLPWPYEVLAAKQVPDGLKELVYGKYATEVDFGLLGIAPDEGYSVPGMTRLIDVAMSTTGSGQRHRHEYLIPDAEIVPVLAALFDDPDAAVALPHRQPDADVRDILVCTHGTIDICCATFGFPAFRILRQVADSTAGRVRAWRCTHFGGHRFAPTVLDLPEARYWGHLQTTDLARLVHRDRPVRDLVSTYRGWSLLTDPIAQVAEREPFAAIGWDWCRYKVEVSVPEMVEPDSRWQVEFAWTDPVTRCVGRCLVEVVRAGTVFTQHGSGTSGELVEQPQYGARIVHASGYPTR
jgi:hypothetical protein